MHSEPPTFSGEQARKAEIVLKSKQHRTIFALGLGGLALFALAFAMIFATT